MNNPILIVIPILALLMFQLGIALDFTELKITLRKPTPIIIGLIGQLIILPLIAFLIAYLFNLPTAFFLGIMLIACCPGGSSSNTFSLLAGGNISLSVLLTTLSSIISLFTIPIVMYATNIHLSNNTTETIHLPVGQLSIQNILLMIVPIILGVASRHYLPRFSSIAENILNKSAFLMLMLLASIFFIQHFDTITSQFATLGTTTSTLIIVAIAISYLISKLFRLSQTDSKTIIFEVGMQNAASAIAIATSPYIFNNQTIAIPAIIYALMMNIILLTYLGIIKLKAKLKQK